MSPVLIYSLAGAALVGVGLHRMILTADPIRRLVAVNVLAVGVASLLIAGAWRGDGVSADPVPHAFVLTGIVVLVSTTAAALALVRRIRRAERAGPAD